MTITDTKRVYIGNVDDSQIRDSADLPLPSLYREKDNMLASDSNWTYKRNLYIEGDLYVSGIAVGSFSTNTGMYLREKRDVLSEKAITHASFRTL